MAGFAIILAIYFLKYQIYGYIINDELAAEVEKYMKRKKYANRSELFRDLLRQNLLEEDKKPNKTTIEAMKNAKSGKNLTKYNSSKDVFKEIK